MAAFEEALHFRRIYRSTLAKRLFADKTVGRVRARRMKSPVIATCRTRGAVLFFNGFRGALAAEGVSELRRHFSAQGRLKKFETISWLWM